MIEAASQHSFASHLTLGMTSTDWQPSTHPQIPVDGVEEKEFLKGNLSFIQFLLFTMNVLLLKSSNKRNVFHCPRKRGENWTFLPLFKCMLFTSQSISFLQNKNTKTNGFSHNFLGFLNSNTLVTSMRRTAIFVDFWLILHCKSYHRSHYKNIRADV